MSLAPGRETDSQAKALVVARAALDKHAEGVMVLDVRAGSSVTDFFVLCTAGSSPQLAALQEHIEAILAQRGERIGHAEGVAAPRAGADAGAPRWVLLDCGDVVIHLLDQHARAFYRLEDLWADAPRVALPPEPSPA